MERSFSLFLAMRYLKPKRTFISVISVVSILGVLLGVMVLILVISVMTGFEQELRRKVVGFDAHLVLTNGGTLENWEQLTEEVKAHPEVVAVAPFAQGPVIVQFRDRRLAPKIRGIDPELEQEVSDIKKFIIDGQLDLEGDKAVLGSELARALGVWVGDTITVYSPGNIGDILTKLNELEDTQSGEAGIRELREMVLPAELEVTGIFESGRYLYDSEFLMVPLHIGQELYNLRGAVHGLAAKTTGPYRAEAIKLDLMERLDPPTYVLSWIDLNKQLFDAIRMERHVMFFLLMFIILVAAFGIMNTLITVTVQKTREIGIMKALGARTWQIIGVFLFQGMVVGAFGTVTGLGLGILLVQYRNQVSDWMATVLGVEVFPASVYQFDKIPAEIVPGDVAIICISGFIICSIAALIPAWFAARLDPVKALRYE